MPHAFSQGGIQQLVDRIPLVVAREQERRVEHLLALGVLGLRHLHRQELAHYRQPRIALKHLVPQVAGGITQSVIGRVARACAAHAIGVTTVEGQKARGRARELGRHLHLVGAHGEVDQRPLTKRQQRLGLLGCHVHRVAVVLVLPHRVFDVLRGVGFQLDGRQGQTVEEQHEVDAQLVVQRVMQLAHHAQAVLLVVLPGGGVLLVATREGFCAWERPLGWHLDEIPTLPQCVERPVPSILGTS